MVLRDAYSLKNALAIALLTCLLAACGEDAAPPPDKETEQPQRVADSDPQIDSPQAAFDVFKRAVVESDYEAILASFTKRGQPVLVLLCASVGLAPARMRAAQGLEDAAAALIQLDADHSPPSAQDFATQMRASPEEIEAWAASALAGKDPLAMLREADELARRFRDPKAPDLSLAVFAEAELRELRIEGQRAAAKTGSSERPFRFEIEGGRWRLSTPLGR